MLSQVVRAIKSLMPKLRTGTTETDNVRSKDYEQAFENTFNKYDFDKIFG